MLWFAEELAVEYPQAKFVGMLRTPHACIASMLRHKGVRKWCEQWDKFPVPNPFLGITSSNVGRYKQASILERSVLRWIAHYHQMSTMKQRLLNKFVIVQYENLVLDPATQLRRLQTRLSFEKPFPDIATKVSSLEKWKTVLSPKRSHI